MQEVKDVFLLSGGESFPMSSGLDLIVKVQITIDLRGLLLLGEMTEESLKDYFRKNYDFVPELIAENIAFIEGMKLLDESISLKARQNFVGYSGLMVKGLKPLTAEARKATAEKAATFRKIFGDSQKEQFPGWQDNIFATMSETTLIG